MKRTTWILTSFAVLLFAGIGFAEDKVFFEGIRIGNSTTSKDGTIRWNGSHFQGYKSGWVDLDAVLAGYAPDDASYVTVETESGLSEERVITEGEGIDLLDGGVNTTLTVSGEDASDTNKGIASFVSSYFSVLSGAVSLVLADGSAYTNFGSASDDTLDELFAAIDSALPTAVSPGGSDGNIQYNDGGVFGGDGDLFWNDTDKRLILRGEEGHASNWAVLNIDNVGGNAGARNIAYSDTATDRASYGFYHRRGTRASPGVSQSGDTLGAVFFGGGYGTGENDVYASTAIFGVASEDFSSGSGGGKLEFYTTDNGSVTRDLRMTIDEDGYVGIGVSDPVAILHVSGDRIQISHVGSLDDVPLIGFTETDNYDEFEFVGNFSGAGGSGNSISIKSDLGGGFLQTWRGDGAISYGGQDVNGVSYAVAAAGKYRVAMLDEDGNLVPSDTDLDDNDLPYEYETITVDIDFSASSSEDVTISLGKEIKEIIRGRLYIDTDPGASFSQWATWTFYSDSDYHGANAFYRTESKIVYTELTTATTGSDANIDPDEYEDFTPNDLVYFLDGGSSEFARLQTVSSTLVAEDNVGAHSAGTGLVRVSEFSGFSVFNTESGTSVYLRVGWTSAQTVSLRMELLARK